MKTHKISAMFKKAIGIYSEFEHAMTQLKTLSQECENEYTKIYIHAYQIAASSNMGLEETLSKVIEDEYLKY